MSILFESSTPIEYLLRDALTKENLDFQEQYRIYTGGLFSEVQYVADFLLIKNNVRLLVECDGFHYHAGKDKKRKQLERDNWLMNKGYKILHFSTKSLTSNMPKVIQTIKYHLDSPYNSSCVSTTKFSFPYSTQPNLNLVKTNYNYNVILFCYYKQIPVGICVVYKYKYVVNNNWSEERIKICEGVPNDMLETTAIYLALLDLKRPVQLKIYYSGLIYNDKFDVSKKLKPSLRKMLKGNELLRTHTISTSYVGLYEYNRFSKKESQKIIKELKSRCFQICNNEEKINTFPKINYSILCKG